MSESYINICSACRKDACMTQESWAEALDVSVETVKAWEGNLRIPSNRMVAMMCDLCGNLYWAYKHLTQSAAALNCLPAVGQDPLPIAAIRIINRVVDFAERNRDRDLMRIAEDGIITDDEKPLYDQIVSELEELAGAAMSLKYSDIKNDRPDVGTSRRSASRG